ncbi:hypothetical protein D9M69_672440 [compost metagenome]
MELRLHGHGLLGSQQHEVADAICGRLGTDDLELGHLLGRGGHDQLAAAPVGHAALCRVAVKRLLALDAKPRLERALRVVDARVNHLAVA